MERVPISLIVDDPAPVYNVYYQHSAQKVTKDGRPLLEKAPNAFMKRFCDAVERYGMGGKFSIVPMPTGKGDIVHGIEGAPQQEIDEWLHMAASRLGGRFDFCPEILTHGKAVNLKNGELYELNEKHWAATQDRTTLTPYIAKAVELLRDAGVAPTGVTSPWDFGAEVEAEYVASVAKAFEQVLGKKDSWYFLWTKDKALYTRPWVAYDQDGLRVVSVAATCGEHFWPSVHCTDNSEEFAAQLADGLISADGKGGELIEVLDKGCWPVLLTHWQTLFSNGLQTGMRALEITAQRIEQHLSDRVYWCSFSDLMCMTLNGEAGESRKIT